MIILKQLHLSKIDILNMLKIKVKHNNREFKITKIKKFYGNNFCYRGEFIGTSEEGQIAYFFFKIKPNLYSKCEQDQWIMSIFR